LDDGRLRQATNHFIAQAVFPRKHCFQHTAAIKSQI